MVRSLQVFQARDRELQGTRQAHSGTQQQVFLTRLTVYYAKFWGRRCRVVTVRRSQLHLPLYSGSVLGVHSASH